ncbi:MAG TPA: hypothetical protein DCR26_07165 [Porphyromonadaceae bacterium]|nr:hypothetical protein [Porphyromonadaceae bacterium]
MIGFSGVNLGLPGPGDESYQALCVADYRNNPLGMLAFFIGHLWQNLWGDTVLSLRCLASLEMLLAVGVASLYLWRRTGRALLSAAVFTFCILVARATAFQLYNWDSGSYLFDAVALVAVASFLRGGDPRKAIVAGVAVACMALARVPSAVFAPVAFGFIWAGCRRHGFSARDTSLVLGGYTAAALASALILVTLMCGSPAEYIARFRPENLVGGHSPSDLPDWIKRIGELGYNQMVWITPSAVAVAAGLLLHRLQSGHRWLRAMAVIFTVALTFVVYRHREAWCDFEWNSLGADLPLTAFLLLLFPVWNLTHTRRAATPGAELWWCAAMVVLMSFGSDTFFERMCGAFTLPVIIAAIWPQAPGAMLRLVRSVLMVSAAVFATVVAEQWVMKARHNTAVPPQRYEALHGLRVSTADLRWLEINETAARTARATGMRYVTCVNRFTPQLIFGRDNGPRLSIFHIDSTDHSQWPPEQTGAVDAAQMIIYNETMPADAPVFAHLRALGFTDVLHRDDVHIFARHADTAAITPETDSL